MERMLKKTNKTKMVFKRTRQKELIELRKEANYSQEFVAEYLGISKNAYNLKENGKTPFLDVEMYKISDLFNRRIEEIFLRPSSI